MAQHESLTERSLRVELDEAQRELRRVLEENVRLRFQLPPIEGIQIAAALIEEAMQAYEAKVGVRPSWDGMREALRRYIEATEG